MVNVVNGVAEFNFFRPNAKSVFVCGDFNDWRRDQLQMTRGSNGYWQLRVPMGSGDYKFRYYCDGAWYTDYAAFGVEPGNFGLDSILHVEPRNIRVDAAPSVQPEVAAA